MKKIAVLVERGDGFYHLEDKSTGARIAGNGLQGLFAFRTSAKEAAERAGYKVIEEVNNLN